MKITFDVLAQIEASAYIGTENPTWDWCRMNATFTHRDACEFIIHIDGLVDNPESFTAMKIAEMLNGGCSKSFVAAYAKAAEMGANRVLFYV